MADRHASSSGPLAGGALGLAHGSGDTADLVAALLGQSEGRLLVIKGRGLVAEDKRQHSLQRISWEERNWKETHPAAKGADGENHKPANRA